MEAAVMRQSNEIIPARDGKMVVITVDATSRVYDLWDIALGTAAINNSATSALEKMQGVKFFITAAADGNDIYYLFDSDSTGLAVDDTLADAAGADPITFGNDYADVIFASTKEPFYISRNGDRFIAIKCAAGKAAKLRLRVSSNLNDGQAAA